MCVHYFNLLAKFSYENVVTVSWSSESENSDLLKQGLRGACDIYFNFKVLKSSKWIGESQIKSWLLKLAEEVII